MVEFCISQMGVSLNGAPPKHPKMIIFSKKTLVVGYHHLRKPPNGDQNQIFPSKKKGPNQVISKPSRRFVRRWTFQEWHRGQLLDGLRIPRVLERIWNGKLQGSKMEGPNLWVVLGYIP